MPSPDPIVVLVEDDEGHATLIALNLRRAGLENGIVHLNDGAAALEALRGEPLRSGPMVLLVDIRLPRLDGLKLLEELKKEPETARLPVIILTTMDDAKEVERCYGLGAAAYITKPVSYDEFSTAIQRLGAFLRITRLPEGRIAQPETT